MALIQVNWNPTPKDLRGFGLIGLVVFSLLAAWLRFRHGHTVAPTLLWAAAACLGAGALLAPKLLKPIYIAMTAASYPIGFVVGHVAMGIIYFAIFTPIALLFRLLGRDALQRRFDPVATSYWLPRRPQRPARDYFRQY